MMFFSFFLFLSLISQETYFENLHFYPFELKPQQIQISPFRGEQNIFEVTQPYVLVLKENLLFYDVTNKKSIPFPGYKYQTVINYITFDESFTVPAYISQNIYFSTIQVYSPVNSDVYPAYVMPMSFQAQVPFSQIRLFKKKTGSENIEFSFGRNITKYGMFNIAADYLNQTAGTRTSIAIDSDFKLPLNNHSHLIFLNIKDDNYTNPVENSLTCFSISRKQADINFFRKNTHAEDILGLVSNVYFTVPHQKITFGFDYPNFDSTNYLITLIDRINTPPLFYFVPRFVIDANKEYALSLGLGYHPTDDAFLFGNILKKEKNALYYNFGFRTRAYNAHFEAYVYSQEDFPEDSSGIVLSYNGNVFPDLSISSLIVTNFNTETFAYIEPFYRKPFKEGKLKTGIFSGIGYNQDTVTVNTGILIEIINVSIYFVFDDIIDSVQREYKFGVQWNFYD